jgi:hypothetical protein
MTMSYNSDLSMKSRYETSGAGRYSLPGMQTRWLLIASAVLAVVIIAAGAAWLMAFLL